MKLLVVGDSHANNLFMSRVIDLAIVKGCKEIVQLGDFGYWPKYRDMRSFVSRTTAKLAKADISLRFIDGNHEDHEELLAFQSDQDGKKSLSSHVKYQPRGSRWEFDGYKMGALGGAVSIDRSSRVLGQSWFREEVPTMADLEALGTGPLDVLFLHDCPSDAVPGPGSPWVLSDTLQRECDGARELLNMAVSDTMPTQVFHGHWHQYVESTIGSIRVTGLAHDSSTQPSCAIFERGKVEIIHTPLKKFTNQANNLNLTLPA